MTERAERLRERAEALQNEVARTVWHSGSGVPHAAAFRTIVTKLGITGECHCGKGDVTCSHCGGNLDACAVLLEASR